MLVGMYIATIPNRNSPPAILVRESYREGGNVKTRTLANVSKLPPEAIGVLRRNLKGEKLVAVDDAFKVIASFHHGHVQAVLGAMRRLSFGTQLDRFADDIVAVATFEAHAAANPSPGIDDESESFNLAHALPRRHFIRFVSFS